MCREHSRRADAGDQPITGHTVTPPGCRPFEVRAMKRIPLSQGLFALVDDRDYERLSAHTWSAQRIGNKAYAARNIWRAGMSGIQIYMHREVLSAPSGVFVDHINDDGLDNRRQNLRLATRGQNMQRSTRHPGQSGFRGVRKTSKTGWTAYLGSYPWVYLGSYPSAEEAAMAYDEAALWVYGPHAYTNLDKSLYCDG